MQKEKIVEGNKLIAKFMSNFDDYHKRNHDKTDRWFFHISWNVLMPVVEKIAENYNINLHSFDGNWTCYILKRNLEDTEISSFGNFNPPIVNIWLAVVKFIQYYNQLTPYEKEK